MYIVVDPKFIPDCIQIYLTNITDKKTLWELTHNITIYGVKEPYIERPKVTQEEYVL